MCRDKLQTRLRGTFLSRDVSRDFEAVVDVRFLKLELNFCMVRDDFYRRFTRLESYTELHKFHPEGDGRTRGSTPTRVHSPRPDTTDREEYILPNPSYSVGHNPGPQVST